MSFAVGVLPNPEPPTRNAAFPGAVLMFVGAYLLYWALEGWGLFGKPAAPTTTAASNG